MPFNSETARMAGKKSRRTAANNKQAVELRKEIQEHFLSGRLLEELEKLDGSEYVRSAQVILQYVLPKLSAVEIASLSDMKKHLDALTPKEKAELARELLNSTEAPEEAAK